MLLQILLFIFPWKFRRYILSKFLKFNIGNDARIGYSIILAKEVTLKNGARIGNFNFIKNIDNLFLDENSKIGNRNWVTGFSISNPIVLKHNHFSHIQNRQCVLHIGKNTSITSRHYFDCHGGIYIGAFCTVAGFETAFMTHSIDLKNNRQDAAPINIGNYTFIGARCTILKGAKLPDYSILGACSLLNKQYNNIFRLYAGCPAKEIKILNDYKYFERLSGFVS